MRSMLTLSWRVALFGALNAGAAYEPALVGLLRLVVAVIRLIR
jgi:hypothetical protein